MTRFPVAVRPLERLAALPRALASTGSLRGRQNPARPSRPTPTRCTADQQPAKEHPMATTHTTDRDPFGLPLPTAEEAAAAHRIGWNLRCNSCGGYGATWIPGMRPGWGSLALCYPHKEALEQMQRRHDDELKTLATVRFEQDR